MKVADCRLSTWSDKTSHMIKSLYLFYGIIIPLCINGRSHVAKGFLLRQIAKTRHHRWLVQPHLYTSYVPTTSWTISICTVSMTQNDYEAESQLRFLPHDNENWTPLNTSTFTKYIEPRIRSRDENTENESSSSSYIHSDKIAASVQAAQTLLDAWTHDDPKEIWSTEWKAVTYFDGKSVDHQIPLYGYLVRNAQFHAEKTPSELLNRESSTYILLFPTAVGSQDLFLFYKAAQIVNHPSLHHCAVLIVDVFSATGWLWDKTMYVDQYNTIREDLLRHSISNDERCSVDDTTATRKESQRRPILQNRIDAAFDYLYQYNGNENFMAAALGWCFGGHCIAELARMSNHGNVRAMITFHGVFSGLQLPSSLNYRDQRIPNDDIGLPRPTQSEVLICHGLQDPFVPTDDLEKVLALLQQYGHTTSLLQLDAKHGFTNPAQVHNDNPSFGYQPESATKAWHQALALLARRIGRTRQV